MDIVDRLLAAGHGELADEAAHEIERLRKDMVAAAETIKFVAKYHPMSASTRTRLTEIAEEMTTAVTVSPVE